MTKNTADSWGWPAKWLHWTGAAVIAILLLHGWWMTHVPPRTERLANYAWHAAIGYDFLVLVVLRLLWRWLNAVPALPADTKPWERIAAHLGHVGLYVLMFAVSLSGWALAGTFLIPMGRDVFGIRVPSIAFMIDRHIRVMIEESHKVLAYVLAALVVIHVAGAIRHHFMKRNDILRRMTWSRRRA